MGLDEQKCMSCEGLATKLSPDEIENMVKQTPGWDTTDSVIERTFAFPNFVTAMQFANKITKIAEEENHHPDLHISWGKVRVELSTHKAGGLTTNDFIVAAKINRLWDEENHYGD